MSWKSHALFGLCIVAALAAIVAFAAWPARPPQFRAAHGFDPVTVLDFSRPFELDPPPRDWRHRKFLLTRAMRMDFAVHQDVAALRCETQGSGSILGRFTDLDLTSRPLLDWSWFVEVPIASNRDERTREGDDHPVRLFVEFADSQNGRHTAEIIWANKLFKPGDYKYIGSFPHYVADGGDANIGQWRDEKVDLLAMYKAISKRSDTPHLRFLGIFCDSDNTGSRSIAYTSSVRLSGK